MTKLGQYLLDNGSVQLADIDPLASGDPRDCMLWFACATLCARYEHVDALMVHRLLKAASDPMFIMAHAAGETTVH